MPLTRRTDCAFAVAFATTRIADVPTRMPLLEVAPTVLARFSHIIYNQPWTYLWHSPWKVA